jgi:ATP/maltotriose-dependent transcriptional regulator MalT
MKGGPCFRAHWMSLLNMAEEFLDEGDAAQAHPLLEESRTLFRELGESYYEGLVLGDLGLVAFHQGNMAVAHSLIEECLTHFQAKNELDIRDGKARTLAHLAQVVAFEGDNARARALYEQCLAIARKQPFQRLTPFYLEGLAGVVAAQGELPWAARLWGAAEALRDSMGTPIPPASRADYERSVAAARTQLGEQAFAAVWAEGRTMNLEQALAAQGPATLPSSPPTKPSPTSPDGLTAREVEVLRLVAQGLTAAHIAKHLVISPRTVNTHLTSIYSKLQVSSRAAATRYAMEHHLV